MSMLSISAHLTDGRLISQNQPIAPQHSQPQHQQSLQQPRSVPNLHQSNSDPVPSPQSGRAPSLAPHAPSPSTSHQFANPRTPYLATNQGPGPRNPPEPLGYYPPQHSHYTGGHTSGGYGTGGGSDIMATAHTMRPSGPTMYNTPQSASPVSVTSPHDTNRSIYGYLGGGYYHHPHPSPNYIHQPAPMPQQQMNPRSQYQMSYQPQSHSLQPAPPPPQASNFNNSPPRQQPMQQPPSRFSHIGQSPPLPNIPPLQPAPSNTSQSGQNAAAPGPIPATTPLLLRQDESGVQWISFEYSRDRVKVQYEIRCDVESVEVAKLPQEHRDVNCVYPRAVNKEKYQGNRLLYETECNEVGWALAWLNPSLKGKRGLIQRAVDSWRNSNQDPKYRSRRVRRMAKNQKRAVAQQQIQQSAQTAPGLPSGPLKPPPVQPQPPQNSSHHHHLPSDAMVKGEGVDLNSRPDMKPQSPSDVRYAQSFQPLHAINPYGGNMGSSMRENIGPSGAHPPNNPTPVAASMPYPGQSAGILRGLPYGAKLKKNMTVKDRQRDAHTRISVKLDGIETDDIPDNHRLKNSVFPRSHYPRQTDPMPLDDASDREDDPVHGRTHVQIHLEDGYAAEFAVPKMRSSKRERERALNDFGCHIMWGSNIRHFTDRNLFLQQALNVFRRDVEDKSSKAGSAVPPLWQVRPGKRRWLDGARRMRQDDEP